MGDDGGVLGEYILHPNYTKAFDYFDQAGKLDGGGRGDALYNAGFMLDSGYVPERGGRHEAIGYYIKAARECGHFDAVSILGLYYAQVCYYRLVHYNSMIKTSKLILYY